MTLALDQQPDLILLDLSLPDMDGREICCDMRRKRVAAPIIMLTAAAGDEDAVQALEAGANDYVTKPYSLAVLLARIRAQLRTHEYSEGAVIRLGTYELRSANKMLIDAQQRKIRLTEKELNILKYLCRAGGESVSREELLSKVWGYNAGVSTPHLPPAPEGGGRSRQPAAAADASSGI